MPRESNQKERIVQAAAVLFAEHGYHGVGMADMEKAVGLRRGALYHHIGNKEALLYEISTTQLTVMVELAERLQREVADEEERIRQLARAVMCNIAEHRLEWTVYYRDFNALTEERLRNVIDLRARYEKVWVDTLQSGVEKGTFLPLTDAVAAKGILGMFNYSYVWIKPYGRLASAKIADVFCDIFLTGIRAPRKGSPRRRSTS